ncbi:MAG: Sec-independent protein translocase subunit TatB [Campylobacteraceae bacterium]|nr:Sec-independent protein translocase subunit TatB [Campylobacteraceae bacterium]
MFGMSFMEIMIIAVIAVLFLGPDKLPTAMVQVAKFFKSFKSSIDDAKSTFEQEIKLQELREDSLKYKKQLEDGAKSIRKKLSFEELEDIKDAKAGVNKALEDLKNDMDITTVLEDTPKKKPEKPKVDKASSPTLEKGSDV